MVCVQFARLRIRRDAWCGYSKFHPEPVLEVVGPLADVDFQDPIASWRHASQNGVSKVLHDFQHSLSTDDSCHNAKALINWSMRVAYPMKLHSDRF